MKRGMVPVRFIRLLCISNRPYPAKALKKQKRFVWTFQQNLSIHALPCIQAEGILILQVRLGRCKWIKMKGEEFIFMVLRPTWHFRLLLFHNLSFWITLYVEISSGVLNESDLKTGFVVVFSKYLILLYPLLIVSIWYITI